MYIKFCLVFCTEKLNSSRDFQVTHITLRAALPYITSISELSNCRNSWLQQRCTCCSWCLFNQSLYMYTYTCLMNLFQSLTGTVGAITTLKQAVNNASSWQAEISSFSIVLCDVRNKTFQTTIVTILINIRYRKWLIVHTSTTKVIS